MFLYGLIQGLKITNDKAVLNPSNLYLHVHGTEMEASIRIDDVCSPLESYLKERAVNLNECAGKHKKYQYRLISLAELKLRYCILCDELSDENKKKNIPYVQYKMWDQLKELIKEIDMIVKIGRMKDQEIYLKFCLI